uniref:Uncharacterized protein n=1 Tax=Fagus sylvatica TaxID=28930 RepID=A0A2N9I4Q8_FAGSY
MYPIGFFGSLAWNKTFQGPLIQKLGLDPVTLVDDSTSAPVNPPDVVDGTPRNSPRGGGHGRGAPRGGGRARGAPRGGGRARGADQAQRVYQAPILTAGTNLEDHPIAPESASATSIHPMDTVMWMGLVWGKHRQRGPEQTEAPQVDHPQQPQRRILPKRIKKKLRSCGTWTIAIKIIDLEEL